MKINTIREELSNNDSCEDSKDKSFEEHEMRKKELSGYWSPKFKRTIPIIKNKTH